MPGPEQAQISAELRVKVGGSDLSQDVVADLIAASVHDDLEHPSAFSITLQNWDAKAIAMKWSDDDLFQVGKQVEISMGYVGQTTSLISGEITGLELEFQISRLPKLIIRGYDRSHRLARGRNTMSYTNVRDSDLAIQIAGNHGLSAQVESTSETFKYVLQHDQTDAAFLRSRARRIGFEMYVRGKDLFFRSRKNSGDSDIVVSANTGLLEFFPRLSTMQQSAKVEMRGWNPDEKSAWVGSATYLDESETMGAQQAGLLNTLHAFGETSVSSGAHPVASQSDADASALGLLKDMSLTYIMAEGTTLGRADLRAGSLIKVQGMGKRFSGLYYLSSTTHTYLPQIGYRTSFHSRRNAA